MLKESCKLERECHSDFPKIIKTLICYPDVHQLFGLLVKLEGCYI